jgi:hypothetical protein
MHQTQEHPLSTLARSSGRNKGRNELNGEELLGGNLPENE